MSADDPYDLGRFVAAQDAGGSHERALAELRAGRKATHWMWWVFPQLAGLGRSPTARRYAVSGPGEARAFLAHPLLGPRLHDAGRAALAAPGSAEEVLGGVDALKLRSSMTLWLRADPADPLWAEVLRRWFGGEPDPATDGLLAGWRR